MESRAIAGAAFLDSLRLHETLELLIESHLPDSRVKNRWQKEVSRP